MTTGYLGYVTVVGKKGLIHVQWISDTSYGIWEAMKANWPQGKDSRGVETIIMPESAAVFKKARPLGCLFDAVDKYMTSMLGMKLDNIDDWDFFANHDCTRARGVPQPYTLRVVQELIEPYDLKISRVRIMPGILLTEDLKQWPFVLGTNPIGLGNRATSNAEFAKLTNQPLLDVSRDFRFEYSEESLRPAIVCGEHGWDSQTKSVEPLGHATYIGPRAKTDRKFNIQLQIARGGTWNQDPVYGPVPPNTDKELDIYNSLGKGGQPLWKTIPQTKSSTFRNVGGACSGTWQDVDSQVALVGSQKVKSTIRECYICGDMVADRIGANLCIRCWATWMKLWKCGECGNTMTGVTFTARLVGLTRNIATNQTETWTIKANCPWCNERNEFEALPGTAADAIAKAIRAERGGVAGGNKLRSLGAAVNREALD